MRLEIKLKDEIGRAYERGGQSYEALAEAFNVSRGTVRRAVMAHRLSRTGVVLKTREKGQAVTSADEAEVCQMYKDRSSIDEIYVATGLPPAKVSKVLRKHCYEIRRKGGADARQDFDPAPEVMYEFEPGKVRRLLRDKPRDVSVDFPLGKPNKDHVIIICKESCEIMPLVPVYEPGDPGILGTEKRRMVVPTKEFFEDPALEKVMVPIAFLPFVCLDGVDSRRNLWGIPKMSWPRMKQVFDVINSLNDKQEGIVLYGDKGAPSAKKAPLSMSHQLVRLNTPWPKPDEYLRQFPQPTFEEILEGCYEARKALRKAPA